MNKGLCIICSFLVMACSGVKQTAKTSKTDSVQHKKAPEFNTNVSRVPPKDLNSGIKTKSDTLKLVDTTTRVVKHNLSENTLKTLNKIATKKEASAHKIWNTLLKKYVSKNGTVNYKGFKTEREKLIEYFSVLDSLYISDHKLFSRAEQLAFWINAYNAFTVDLIIRNYPIKSIKAIDNPWEQRLWKLGEKWYHLNDIEHQILRKMNEPRVHFAIVCASYSCPKLLNEAFTTSNIEAKLTEVTKAFLKDSEKNIITENSLQLSKIFQWFAKDFKQNGSLIDFLNRYVTITISAKAKKSFKPYNWDLNE